MITYELHTLKNDITQTEWAMMAVFEDLELAMHDATWLDETKRYAGIRVVEKERQRQNRMPVAARSSSASSGGMSLVTIMVLSLIAGVAAMYALYEFMPD